MSALPLKIASLLALAAVTRAAPLDDLARWLAAPAASRPALAGQAFAEAPLTKAEAAQALESLGADRNARVRAASQAEWQAGAFNYGAFVMKFKYRTFGAKPPEGRSLYISLHGGGAATPDVNDEQWNNQIDLYRPKEGIYLAPRAPTNDWDLWHQAQIDPLFDRIIQACVAFLDVNPDKVYVMGYSAGGDGVYQLAPRMVDHWAAAAMMAGHPGDASPLNLRNIGFTIHVGALDAAYNRNGLAQVWKGLLDSLAKADGAYVHEVQVHAGLAHWMNLEDSVAVPWMAKFRRNPVPPKVVWRQDNVTHKRLYWLSEPDALEGEQVRADVNGVTISITQAIAVRKLDLLLNDELIDLDKNVTVTWLGKQIYQGPVRRTIRNLWETLEESGDARMAFSGKIATQNGVAAAVRPAAPHAAKPQGRGRAAPVLLFGNSSRDAAGRRQAAETPPLR
jgi:hypothetical protein